jgi:hypothetical protein
MFCSFGLCNSSWYYYTPYCVPLATCPLGGLTKEVMCGRDSKIIRMIKLLRSYAYIRLSLIDCRYIQVFTSLSYINVLAVIPQKHTSYCDSCKSLKALHSHNYTNFKISGTYPVCCTHKGQRKNEALNLLIIDISTTEKLDYTKCFRL